MLWNLFGQSSASALRELMNDSVATAFASHLGEVCFWKVSSRSNQRLYPLPTENPGQAMPVGRARLSGCKRGDAQIRTNPLCKNPNLCMCPAVPKDVHFLKSRNHHNGTRRALRSYPQWRAKGCTTHSSFDTKSADKRN